MLIRVLVAAVLFAPPAFAQTVEKPKVSEWIGTLEYTDAKLGFDLIATRVTLEGPPTAFTGRWISKFSSGTLKGSTDDKGRINVDVTMYSPAVDNAGNVTDPEGCVGNARFVGRMFRDFVMRWTAKEVTGGDCRAITNVVITLQPRE